MVLACDCYVTGRCRNPATQVLIDAKGRPRLSCPGHVNFPSFDHTRDAEVMGWVIETLNAAQSKPEEFVDELAALRRSFSNWGE